MDPSESSQSSDHSTSEHSDSGASFDDASFHQQMKGVLFDVSVPQGLKESVLESLAQNQVALESSDDSTRLPKKSFRKNPGLIAGLSACLVFAAMLAYTLLPQAPLIDLSELNPGLDLNSQLLADFDNNFSEQFPTRGAWQLNGRLVFTQKSCGISVSQAAHHDAIARFFTLHMGHGLQPVYGALLQLPTNRVESLPALTRFDPVNVEYTQLAKGNYATVKWVEDDRVYVCIVFGGARELEALDRALQTPSA